MPTLEQDRATLAFRHVTRVKAVAAEDEERKKKYGSIVHALPVLLRTAGLSQALHFVASRKPEAQRDLLDHLVEQLNRCDPGIDGRDSLLARVREADLPTYLLLTHEALACAVWYRRFVQGILGVEAGENHGD